MALARWTGVVQDAYGNALAGASIEVRSEETGALVALFSDRDGAQGMANPFTANDATFFFHVAGGSYRVGATLGSFALEWRYVSVGTAAELDAEVLLNDISASLATALRVIEQDFGPEEQERARLNIAAAAADSVVRHDIDQSGAIAVAGKRRARVNIGSIFTDQYVSGEQSITAGGLLTLAHGLGSKPKKLSLWLVCKTAEHNFSPGDEFEWGHVQYTVSTAGARGAVAVADATNVRVRFGATADTFIALNLGTGGAVVLTLASWRLIVKAWA